MANDNLKPSTDRRGFLGSLAASAAAVGLATLTPTIPAHAGTIPGQTGGPDDWFDKIKGKHRVVFDSTEPNDVFPFAWPRVFLLTNAATGTAEKDCSVVVVLRHSAIGYAFEDRLWEKYKMGEMFKANDPKTQAPATRNIFWKPQHGDFSIPGVGPVPIGINELQASGVMFCVCNMALTVYSAVAADKMKMKPEDVKKEWMDGLLPEIELVPSGVWAVGRAQEHGCGYIFAG